MDRFIQIYFALAIGYNLASLVRIDWRGNPLGPTEPVPAIALLLTFYLTYAAQPLIDPMFWHALMLIFIALIGRFGVVAHLVGCNAQDYSSPLARAAAVSINAYGIVALLMVLLV